MSKRERIKALEDKVAALEREVASFPRWTWTAPYQPSVMPTLRVGDGPADIAPIVAPTISWGNTTGGTQ